MLTITAGLRASFPASTSPSRGSSQAGLSESSAMTWEDTRSAVREEMCVIPTARSSSERSSRAAADCVSK